MRVQVGNRRLFFDVDGAKLVPDGPWMRERQSVVLLHPGPGFDHLLFKIQLGPWLAERAQVVYVDQRGGGRTEPAGPEELRLERWADDVRELCDALTIERPVVLGMGFGALVALAYASRHPSHPGRSRWSRPSPGSFRNGRSRSTSGSVVPQPRKRGAASTRR